MAVINQKPNMNQGLWGESGNIETPSSDKISLGWVVEKPLNVQMNWVQNRQDTMLQYLNQRGIPEWDSLTDYPVNAHTVRSGTVYRALSQNKDKDPTLSDAIWEVSFTTHQTGVSLTSEVNKIKNVNGYLDFYVSRLTPVFNASTKGFGYLDTTGGMGFTFEQGYPTIYNSGRTDFKFTLTQDTSDSSNTVATTAWVQSLINSIKNTLAPVGSVVASATRTVPEGYLECNGNTVSRVTYNKLFQAIGTTYGSGDGSTTFSLPDLRGEFLRGLDSGRGVDVGRTIGSFQGDAIRNIKGYLGVDCNSSSPPADEFSGAFYDGGANRNGDDGNTSGENRRVMFDASRVVPVADENRPRNIAMTYIIKY